MVLVCTILSQEKHKVILDFFKDILFDVINESDELGITDIYTYDREDLFLITMADESEFEIILIYNKKKTKICEGKLRRTRQLPQSIMEIYGQGS